MKQFMRNVSGFTKDFSCKKSMWIIFGTMWANMVLMILALLIAVPGLDASVMILVALGISILAGGILFWRQMFDRVVSRDRVNADLKIELEETRSLLEAEKAAGNERIKELRRATMKAGLADDINHQIEDEIKYLREIAGQTRTSLFKMADAIDIELQDNIQNITVQAEKASMIAGHLTDSARTVGNKSDTVAEGAAQALENTDTVQQSTEGLRAAVEEITNQMKQTTELTQEAVSISNETQKTIFGLEEAAQGIEEIISLISNIARQTNLLALNATIEAARAGEAGKGFAVVASEVKGLASQTTQSIDDITEHIKGIQTKVGDAVKDIDRIKRSIDNVQASSDVIREEVARQGQATRQIADNVTEARVSVQTVTDGVRDISVEANSNVTIVEEINQISEKLASQVLSIRSHMLNIVQCALKENERRDSERIKASASSTISVEGHEETINVQIMDYSMGGMQIKLLDPMPPEGSKRGKVSGGGQSGTEINFNIWSMQDDIIRAEFNDDEELIRMFNVYLGSQNAHKDEDDVLEGVELFG